MRVSIFGLITGLVIVVQPVVAEPRDFCPRESRYRGAALDFDVKDADIHDVFRTLADAGRVNIVLPNTIKARVTMRLRKVPWDQIACTIAAVHQLAITADGNVLLVRPRAAERTSLERDRTAVIDER